MYRNVMFLVGIMGLSACLDDGSAQMLGMAASGNLNQQQLAGVAVGMAQRAAAEEEARQAAYRERQRIAALQQTPEGRAQLAREAQQQRAMAEGIVGLGLAAILGGGMGSGGGSSYDCQGADWATCANMSRFEGGGPG